MARSYFDLCKRQSSCTLKRHALITAILPLGLCGLVNVGVPATPHFAYARASYLSPLVPDILFKARNVRHVFFLCRLFMPEPHGLSMA